MLNKHKLFTRKTNLKKLSPLLIWLFFILLPNLSGLLLLQKSYEIEKEISLNRIKEALFVESNKYNSENDLISFLAEELKLESCSESHSKMSKSELLKAHQSHPFFNKLPREGTTNLKADLKRTKAAITRVIGSEPDLIGIIASSPESIYWEVGNDFKIHTDARKFRRALVSAHTVIIERIRAGKKASEHLLNLSLITELKNSFGILNGFSTRVFDSCNRFSTAYNTTANWSLLALPGSEKTESKTFLFYVFLEKNLNRRKALAAKIKKLNNKDFKHCYGLTSLTKLPEIVKEDDQISIVIDLPEAFRNAFSSSDNRFPSIRISFDSSKIESLKNLKKYKLLVGLLLGLSFPLFVAIFFNRIQIRLSLKKVISAFFLFSMIFPLAGFFWMWNSYTSLKKYALAEKILDWSNNQFQIADIQIQNEKIRVNTFHSIMANWINKMSSDQISKLNKKIGFFAPNQEVSNKISSFSEVLFSYYLIDKDDREAFGQKRRIVFKSEDSSTFFSGLFRNCLSEAGSYNHLSLEKRNRILQKASITNSLISDIIDFQIVSNLAKNSGQFIPNSMSPKNEYLNLHFLKTPDLDLKAILLISIPVNIWVDFFIEKVKQNFYQSVFFKNGYKIAFAYFANDNLTFKSLKNYGSYDPLNKVIPQVDLLKVASNLYSNSGSNRIINLDSSSPHLISTSVIGNSSVFALAYAIPANKSKSQDLLLIFCILILLLGCVTLSRKLSNSLGNSIAPFQQAISKLEKNDFNWELSINSGDEFEILQNSFNELNRSLQEKEKISQLVSKNVMDAISSESGIKLQPGGDWKKASILFSDIRGFTTITEKYSPESIVEMLNQYFEVMEEAIVSNGGFIDKLIGDAIQAVFYEKNGENISHNAFKAAKMMHQKLEKLNEQRSSEGLFTINSGFGITTDRVISGRVGSESGKLDATVIGSSVNLASELEALSKKAEYFPLVMDSETSRNVMKFEKNLKIQALKINDVSPSDYFEIIM